MNLRGNRRAPGKRNGGALQAPARSSLAALVFGALLLYAGDLKAQESVSFSTADGGSIQADLYGKGERGLVLAHGARFDKESWAAQAKAFSAAGFRVLSLDFRGYGQSRGPGDSDPLSAPLYQDVLAAVRCLKSAGASSVSVVGASMGGAAAAEATIEGGSGEIDRVVLLGAWAKGPPERMKGRKLFLTTRDDAAGDGTRRLPKIREQFEKAAEPKELVVLEGSAHAQFLFETNQGDRVMREILRFLTAP